MEDAYEIFRLLLEDGVDHGLKDSAQLTVYVSPVHLLLGVAHFNLFIDINILIY
jgi:hypothetical protein